MSFKQGFTWLDHILPKLAPKCYVLRNLAQFCSSDILKLAWALNTSTSMVF